MSQAGKCDRNEWTLHWRGYRQDGYRWRSCICIRQTIIGADDGTVSQATKDNVVPELQSKAIVENKTEKDSLVVENDASNEQLTYTTVIDLRISESYLLTYAERG